MLFLLTLFLENFRLFSTYFTTFVSFWGMTLPSSWQWGFCGRPWPGPLQAVLASPASLLMLTLCPTPALLDQCLGVVPSTPCLIRLSGVREAWHTYPRKRVPGPTAPLSNVLTALRGAWSRTPCHLTFPRLTCSPGCLLRNDGMAVERTSLDLDVDR